MIGHDRSEQIWFRLQRACTYQGLTGLQIAVILCALSAASIRLYGGMLPYEEWYLRVLSLLHGIAFLGLLVLFFLPRLASRHHMVCFVLAGYAWISVMLWIFFGLEYDLVGYVSAAIEACLSVLAFYEGCRTLRFAGSHEEVADHGV